MKLESHHFLLNAFQVTFDLKSVFLTRHARYFETRAEIQRLASFRLLLTGVVRTGTQRVGRFLRVLASIRIDVAAFEVLQTFDRSGFDLPNLETKYISDNHK